MARTNIGAAVAIATESDGTTPDPQQTDLTASTYAALSYTDIPNVITVGDTGVNQNIVSQPLWDNRVSAQQKGSATGATFPITILDEASNGRTALDAAAAIAELNNFAFRITYSDGTIEYNRGVVAAPTYPKGGNEEFSRATYQVATNQAPIFA